MPDTPPLPTRVVASDSNAPVKAQRIDPTLPGIKRYQSLGIREVPAKERGPGELNNLHTGRNLTTRKRDE